jgi:hypothetical protein
MEPDQTSEAPIVCILEANDFKRRLAWIAELNRKALRGYVRDGLVLHVRYDGKFADCVKEMVRREERCCAFLRFEVQRKADEVFLTITAPEEARVAADTLFEQFVTCGQSAVRTPARIALACACAAVTCGAACVAPLALPATVLATTGSMLALLARAHGSLTVLAVFTVAAAWLWVSWQSMTGLNLPPSTFGVLGIATVLLAVAVAWPFIEPQVARQIGP